MTSPLAYAFDPNEPRDETGKWTEGRGGAAAKASEFSKRSKRAEKRTGALSAEELRADTKAIPLTPEQDDLLNLFYGHVSGDLKAMPPREGQSHAHALHAVVSRLPKKAIQRIRQNVNALHLAAGYDPVTEEFKKRSPLYQLKEGNVIFGFYDTHDGTLWSDGMEGADVDDTQRGVLSHELGHGIDGPKFELSTSPEWQEAHEAEIAGKQLSDYAATEPREGFAEFARAVYGSDVQREEVERLFPLCTAFFKKRGLV